MLDLLDWVRGAWPYLFTVTWVSGAAWVTVDAVLRKRHTNAVVGWVGLAWLAPITGAVAYYLLGINRIHAGEPLDRRPSRAARRRSPARPASSPTCRIRGSPGWRGDRVRPALDGHASSAAGRRRVPAMPPPSTPRGDRSLRAVSTRLRRMAGRCTRPGAGARSRSRVLIDDVGSRYTRPTMVRVLREAGVPVAAFLPTRVPRLYQYANLRMHRKIMVVDGRTGFTGGMNIRAVTGSRAGGPRVCTSVEGPVLPTCSRPADWASPRASAGG
jgi:cardiolipin synthase